MFAILLSAFWTVLGFVLRSILIKFVVFFALYFVVGGFVDVLVSSDILPSAELLTAGLSAIPPGVWYFLDLVQFSTGIEIVISATTSKFIIRRIPLIG